MAPTPIRFYHRVDEDKRIQIITLREQRCTLREIWKETKVKKDTVQTVLRKWKHHYTIRDLHKTGRLVKVDACTRWRLARMAQSGEVSIAPELALTAATHDLVHVSASTARNVLHQEGLKVMHMIRKSLPTGEYKRRRLQYASKVIRKLIFAFSFLKESQLSTACYYIDLLSLAAMLHDPTFWLAPTSTRSKM
ncbi:hypothetical protein EON65_41430 [archaeon]|nr:MAG: hypothetical protein EON65_41430 [archaeon]